MSPESIIISSNGRLLDGQHRLRAVVESNASVPMRIETGWDESVFSVLDRGAPRTVSDSTGIPAGLAQIARLALACERNEPMGRNLGDDEIEEMALFLEPMYNDLITVCGARAKFFSSAPYRLAACVRAMNGNQKWCFQAYRSLVLSEIDEMSKCARSLFAQVFREGKRAGSGAAFQMDSLARAWVVFDFSRKDSKRVIVRDPANSFAEVGREIKKLRNMRTKNGERYD